MNRNSSGLGPPVKTAPAQQKPEGLRLRLILNKLLFGQKTGFFRFVGNTR
jgi:hypothetical protein